MNDVNLSNGGQQYFNNLGIKNVLVSGRLSARIDY